MIYFIKYNLATFYSMNTWLTQPNQQTTKGNPIVCGHTESLLFYIKPDEVPGHGPALIQRNFKK